MADMLEFTTKPKDTDADGAAANEVPPFRFKVDGVEMVAVRPKDALIAQIAPVTSRRTPPALKLNLALNFLDDCLQEPGRTILRERVLDPDDDLDAEQCMDVLKAIGEHWREHAPAKKGAGRR